MNTMHKFAWFPRLCLGKLRLSLPRSCLRSRHSLTGVNTRCSVGIGRNEGDSQPTCHPQSASRTNQHGAM